MTNAALKFAYHMRKSNRQNIGIINLKKIDYFRQNGIIVVDFAEKNVRRGLAVNKCSCTVKKQATENKR